MEETMAEGLGEKFKEVCSKDAVIAALNVKLKFADENFTKALQASQSDPSDENSDAALEAATKLEQIKDLIAHREGEIMEKLCPTPKVSTQPTERRKADFHDPTEEFKELKEVPRMPKLSEADTKSIYSMLLFKRKFVACMENAVPLEEKRKRYFLIAIPPRFQDKLNLERRSETSLDRFFELLFEKVLKKDWKRLVRNDLEENIRQMSHEGIEDFGIRLKLYFDFLNIDADDTNSLELLRRKSRKEFEEVWQSVGEGKTFVEWIAAGERLELKPSFGALKQSFAAKKHCQKCGKDSHWTSEHGKLNKGKIEECRDFAKTGKCPRGEKCRFKHTKKETDSTPKKGEKASTDKPQKEKTHKYASKEEWLKNATCHKCKEVGHISKNCPKEDLGGFHARAEFDIGDLPEFEKEGKFSEYWEACNFFNRQEELGLSAMMKMNAALKDPVMFPALVGGIQLHCTHDSGTSYTSADTKIYTRLPGVSVEMKKPIRLALARENIPDIVLRRYKEVEVIVDRQPPTKWLIFDSENTQKERILVADSDAQKVGIRLQNIPLRFPQPPKESDQKWAEMGSPNFNEEKAPKEDCDIVWSLIQEEVEKNALIPQDSRCVIPNCEFKIDLKTEVPVYKHQYPYPKRYTEYVTKQRLEWLSDGRIVPFHSKFQGTNEYNNPLNPVAKISGGVIEEGTCRVTADMRGQNANTKEPSYVLPRIADMLQKLQGCKYFAEIDLKHAYHQIPLHEDSQKVTGFIGDDGVQYVFTVMVEGLKGAAAHMQFLLDSVIAPIGEDASRYIDNILIGGKTPQELGRKLIKTLRAITGARLRINPAKCKWCCTRIKFMGALIDQNTRAIDPVKVNVFQNMNRPKTGAQMESLLGFTNFIRDFIPLYACLVGPLEKLRKLKKISDLDWNNNGAKEAFETLKKILSSAPVLSTIDWTLELYIGTDSSQYGVGAVLFQITPDGITKYIDFAAKSLNAAQCNYPASKRELLAVMFALKRWRNILLGNHFYIEVDNKALQYMAKSQERMILDWTDFILEFDFTITYKKGVLNVLPHYLSHLYACVKIDPQHEESRQDLHLNVAFLRVNEMGDDRVAERMRQFIKEVIHKEEPSVEKRYELVRELHSEGHVGADLMFRTLFKTGYYWSSMYKDCEKESGSCLECLRFNIGRVGFHPLSPALAAKPFDHVAIDFIVLKTSLNGFNFILLLVDVFTRFIVLRALKSKTAEEVAWVLLCVFADFGVPKIIQSDSDRSFFNSVITAMKEIAGFDQRRIMKYFPKANGLPERFVQETKRLLEKWNRGDWSCWDIRVPILQMTLNDRILSIHSSKAFSVLFAREFNGFADFRNIGELEFNFERLEERNQHMIECVFPSIAEMEKQNRESRTEKENEKELKKRNVKRNVRSFGVGDTVMKAVDVRQGSEAQRWEGPFTIVEFEPKAKGYRLLNSMNRLVSGYVPAARLRIVQHADEKDLTGFHEIKKICAHRGVQGNREYLVQWKKGGKKEWVHELDCDAYDMIKSYWAKIVKKTKAEAKRPGTPPLVIDDLVDN